MTSSRRLGWQKPLAEWLSKESRVLVEGTLRLHQWETETDEKRSKHRILARNIQFLSPPRSSESGADAEESQGARARSTPDWSSGWHTFKTGDNQTEQTKEAADDPTYDDVPF